MLMGVEIVRPESEAMMGASGRGRRAQRFPGPHRRANVPAPSSEERHTITAGGPFRKTCIRGGIPQIPGFASRLHRLAMKTVNSGRSERSWIPRG